MHWFYSSTWMNLNTTPLVILRKPNVLSYYLRHLICLLPDTVWAVSQFPGNFSSVSPEFVALVDSSKLRVLNLGKKAQKCLQNNDSLCGCKINLVYLKENWEILSYILLPGVWEGTTTSSELSDFIFFLRPFVCSANLWN